MIPHQYSTIFKLSHDFYRKLPNYNHDSSVSSSLRRRLFSIISCSGKMIDNSIICLMPFFVTLLVVNASSIVAGARNQEKGLTVTEFLCF
jgi:hypothetical protein